jgi:hypothetical protein
MAQLKIRRAAAVLVLASLLPVSTASAAPRLRPQPHHAAVSGFAGWIRSTVVEALWKAGIRIDPWGVEIANGGH